MFFRGRHRLFPPGERKDELLRWAFLLAAVLWLFHPFLTGRAIGTGDAIWYEHMLADFVLQWRAGIFPVFVGQTEYAFNGAVYPLRVAPLFQHWAGVLDLLTFHRLSFFWLQHLVVVTVAVSGIASCYFCLCALAPRHRWLAALLAVFYVTCPGVVGVVVVQDLYMSWMTLPFLPILMFGLARSFRNDDGLTWAAIAGSLAALWLAHAPIALWACLIAGAIQLYRLCTSSRNRPAWTRAILGAAVFALLAQYPFVSVATLHTGAASPASGSLEHPERIVQALENAFPGCLLPLSPGASRLSDLQLGYALWSAVILAIGAVIATKEKTVLIFLCPIAALLLLLLPLPHWTRWFWVDFSPEVLRRLTYYWPMHRFYLLLASLASFGGFAACVAWLKKYPTLAKPMTIFLAVGCLWSLWQASEFVEAAKIRTATVEDTARKERPENRLLMNHAYGLFEKLPATFSNGVVDPRLAPYLIGNDDSPKPTSYHETTIISGKLLGSYISGSKIIYISPAFQLEYNTKYNLYIHVSDRDMPGILQITGPNFFREYQLPHSGEKFAFGTSTPNSAKLNLWTTQKEGQIVHLIFIPDKESLSSANDFGEYNFCKIDPQMSSIQAVTIFPFSATIMTREPVTVAFPQMFVQGYQALVDGKNVPLKKTPDGLCAVDITRNSRIEIKYTAPKLLLASYLFTLSTWGVTSGFVGVFLIKKYLKLRHQNNLV